MSIKKDNVSATAVKYNNQDVNKVILDNKCVWCKAFTYTQGTLPTGVASFTCTRSSTDEPTASTGTISNGGTIYYDDKLYWTATASTGYRITAVKGSSSPVTVSGAVTGTSASGLASARISGTISQGTLPTGVASIKCYRKAYNGSSFSEYTGSTIYYGDQFYWTATASTGYNNPSLTYNSSSKAYTWNGSQGGAITSVGNSGLSAGSRRSFTISFGTTANKTLYGSWSKSSQTAYYGDKITVSGTTVICYKWDATSTERWRVTVTPSSNTAQYTYSGVTLVGSSITSVSAAATFTASNTRTLNSYTITWKYLSAYPDTWTTATEAYTYGATPSRTASNVTSGSVRKVPTGWDSLATVTGNRTITASYKTQVKATFTAFRCVVKVNGAAAPNGWYDIGSPITWTANTNCAFSSNGSTTTVTETISTQKTNYTASADYVNVTSVNGNNCTAYADSSYTTAFTTGWKSINTTIYWKASDAYAFDETYNHNAKNTPVSPGANTASANFVKRYTLTISATNGSYGTYSVSRTKSPYQGAATGTLSNGATIYYGDTLTGTSSAKAVSYDGWSVTSVTAPTFTTTGDATSGNLTIKNNSGYSATLYYNTSNAVGGTSAGTAPANTPKIVTGLDFNKQYYISARVSRTRTKHTYATDGTQYSGTSSVTGNVKATFKFKDTTSTDSGTIDSSVVPAKTAAQSTYTITWKYLSAYPSTWTTTTQSYKYGTTPSRTSPDIVTSGNERKVFASWDNLATVTGNRTITATYKTQYAPTITPSYCKADKISGKWYDAGTVITWTANDNYSFGGSTVKDTTTTKIEAGNVTYSKAPGYVKCTIEGTRCNPSKTSGSILAVGTDITYTASSGYSYTEHDTTASNPKKHTVALGTTSYSRSCDYKYITVAANNCIANVSTGYRKLDNKITWTANSGTNYKYSFSIIYADSDTSIATIKEDIASYSKTASSLWYNVTIKPATNCTADKSSGYLLKDSTVTFTIPAAVNTTSKRYSFSASNSTTTTCTKTVSSPGQTIANDTAYVWMNCTFSGTNLASKPNDDWYRAGSTSPMFIAGTATNIKYSFANTSATTPTPTATVTIVDGTTSYTKNASYEYYNVTVTKGTDTASSNYESGYYLKGTTITFSAKTSTSTVRYSYSSSTSDADSQSHTVSSAGQTISSGTVYTWYNVTSTTGTNCTAYSNSNYSTAFTKGWYRPETPIYWKASEAYAFNEYNTDTYNTRVAAGANTASATFVKRYTLTLTKNSHVQTISVWRTSSPYQGASVGGFADPLLSGTGTTTVYYGDTLAGSAGAESPGYHFGNDNSVGVQAWSQTITDNVTWAPKPSANKYDITFNGNMCTWTYSSCVSNYGDRIKTSLTKTSATLTCYQGISSSARWTNTVSLTGAAIKAGMKLQITGYTEDTPITDNITINATGVKNVTPITTCKYTLRVSDSFGITGAYLSTNASSTATSGSTTVTANMNTKVYVYFTLTHDMHTTHLSAYTLRSGTAGKAGALYRSTEGHTSSTVTPKTLTLSLDWNDFDIVALRTGSKVGSIDLNTPGIITADGYRLSKSGSTITATYTDFNGVSKQITVGSYTVPNGYIGTLHITNRNGATVGWNTYINGSYGPYVIVLETTPRQSSGT